MPRQSVHTSSGQDHKENTHKTASTKNSVCLKNQDRKLSSHSTVCWLKKQKAAVSTVRKSARIERWETTSLFLTSRRRQQPTDVTRMWSVSSRRQRQNGFVC